MKQFVALARVSSREQEREGFSLDVQEDALRRYVEREGGEFLKLYRISETASKNEVRGTFKEMLAFVKENAARLDGLLFYKVDRAARNLFDYVELERLEEEQGIPVVYISQPTENTPAGRMQRRILANMASFYTEQQSLDVQEGMKRRAESGLFVGHAPYGYGNVRVDGRGLVEVDEEQAEQVRRVFALYASGTHTLDTLGAALRDEGLRGTAGRSLSRSKLHDILHDRSYLGEVPYRGHWYPGVHPELVDNALWERVQARLRGKPYAAHDLVFAGSRLHCGDCGKPVTGERKTKQTKAGQREYVYYRCARYTRAGHPRTRVREHQIDAQFQALFGRLRVEDERITNWVRTVLQERASDRMKADSSRRERNAKELRGIDCQRERLLDLRLGDEIDGDTFKTKDAALKSRKKMLQAEGNTCNQTANKALKLFELSQGLSSQWLKADTTTKRRIIDATCLNCTLNGATLSVTMRKPFDVIAEGLNMQDGRGDWI